jgi:hypothetical protein
MNKINILLADIYISESKTAEAISDNENFKILNFRNEFTHFIKLEENSNVKKLIDEAEIIPDYILKSFLINKFIELKSSNILFVGLYSKKGLKILKKSLNTQGLTVNKIWYVKQKDSDIYKIQFCQNPPNASFEKYLEEIEAGWKNSYCERKDYINFLKTEFADIEWKIIEMDYIKPITKEYIINKINDRA